MAGKKGEAAEQGAEPQVAEQVDASSPLDRRVNAIEHAIEFLSAEVVEIRHKINDLGAMALEMKNDQRQSLNAFAERLDKLDERVRGLRPLPGNEPVLTQEELLRLIAEHKQNPAAEGPTSQYAGKKLRVVAAAAFSHGSIGSINKGSIFFVADNAEKIVECVGRGLMVRHYTGD